MTVEDDGKALELLSDYTLMYSNNRKAGTGVAAVAGKGNYTATKNLTFDIRPCDAGAAVVTGASADSLSISWTGDGRDGIRSIPCRRRWKVAAGNAYQRRFLYR